MRVYIFGASTAGERCYEEIKNYCEIMGFIDNDCDKWGKHIRDGIIAYSPQVLEKKREYDVIVVASMYYQDIMIQLEKNDIHNYILSPISPEDFEHPNFRLYLDYNEKAYRFYKKFWSVQKKIDTLLINEYHKEYFLGKTLQEIYWYAEIFWNVFKYHGEPNILLDYGSECGLLGMFAKYLGIENVYYNGICEKSCKDAKVIANEMNLDLRDYIGGDLNEVIKYSTLHQLYFDVIVSYEGIEQIFDVEEFFKKLPQVCQRDCFISMWTPANRRHLDFAELSRRIRSFEDIYLLPKNNKETIGVVGFFLQDKAYPYILEEWLDEQESYLYRYRLYYQVIIKWLKKTSLGLKIEDWFLKKGIHRIVVYGGGELGQILYEQLQTDSKVVVEAVCDQNTGNLEQYFIGSRVINLDELIQEYNQNTIVVTPVYAFDTIYEAISNKVKGDIIDLGVIVEEM